MFPAIGRSRALDLCVLSVVTLISGCAAGVPAPPMSFGAAPVVDTMKHSATPPAWRPAALTKAAAHTKASAHTKGAARTKPAARTKAAARIRVDSTALERAVTERHAHWPLAVALAKRTRSPEVADRAAAAVVQEAKQLRLSPSLVAAVLLIENASLDSAAISTEGAIGMMQVMPMHAGYYGCSSENLVNLEANICHGARLLKNFVRRTGSVPLALRRYNGCVRGRNTPRCQRYPMRVLRTASRLRHEMLVTAAQLPADATDSTSGSGTPAECSSFLGCLRSRWSVTR